MKRLLTKFRPRQQSGLASIVVVLMMLVVVSLVSLGIAKLADRANRQSLGNNLSAAADYAARSGINDVVALVQGIPNTESKHCGDLLADGQPFAGQFGRFGSANTSYSCILIDKHPTSIVYQGLEPEKSQVIAIAPKDSIAKFMISWQSTDNTAPNFPAKPSGQPANLYDETYWVNQHYPPMLRVSLYAINSQTFKADDTNSDTFFLYPTTAGNDNKVTVVSDPTTPSSSLLPVKCYPASALSDNLLGGDFTGSVSMSCSLVLDKLPTGAGGGGFGHTNQTGRPYYYYFMRIMPLYTKADVSIQANSAKTGDDKLIDLGGTQYVIDVTAHANNAVKRLQARVTTPYSSVQFTAVQPSDNAIPEYALRTAGSVCKRLQVFPEAQNVLVDPDPTVQAYCDLNLPDSHEGGPPLIFTADDYTLSYLGNTTLHWSFEDNSATECIGTGGEWGDPPGTQLKASQIKAAGDKLTVGPLHSSTTYTLDCKNADELHSIETVNINVAEPPKPQIAFTATPNPVTYNGTTKLSWTVSNGPATWCKGTGGSWGNGTDLKPTNGSKTEGPYTNPDKHQPLNITYTIQCGNDQDPDYHNYMTPVTTQVVTVQARYPLPKLTFSATPNPFLYNDKTKLVWNIDNGPATWCWGTGGPWGSGVFVGHSASNNLSIGPYTADQNLTLQCGNSSANYLDCGNSCGTNGGYATPTVSLAVKVGSQPKITVALQGSSAGDKVTGTGINCADGTTQGPDCTETYNKAQSIVLTAKAGSSSTFSGWDGACSGRNNSCTVKVDRALNAFAIFKKK